MNICFIADHGYKMSGGHLSLYSLIKDRLSRGDNVFVVSNKPSELTVKLEKDGVSVAYIFNSNYLYHGRRTFTVWVKYTLKKIINSITYLKTVDFYKKNKIELVHINSLLCSLNWAVAAKNNNIPVILHVREFITEDHELHFFREKPLRHFLDSTDCVITPSHDLKRYWQNFTENRIEVVRHGIDVESCYLPQKQVLNEDKVKCLVVGRITETKGQEDCIKAIKILHDKGYENISLTIVGYRNQLAYEKGLKKRVENSELRNSVFFVDYTYDTKRLRQQFDIGITASKREAFGLVTVENMVAGLVVVGSDTGGTPDIISSNQFGYLYKQNSVEELASIIEHIVNNREEAKQVARQGQEYAYEMFNIKQETDRINTIYGESIRSINPDFQ